MADETEDQPEPAPRIKQIAIHDFRAFPASQPGLIEVGGCNLLVFGGNGAGKSSIYRALRDLFSGTAHDIVPLRNVFTAVPQPSVRVTLTDETVLTWDVAGHPTTAVAPIARRAAFLSHSRLVEMNTGATADTPPELFELAVDLLLADYEVTVEGGGRRTIAELWKAVNDAVNARVTRGGRQVRPQYFTRDLDAALARFNAGFGEALDGLEARAKELLRRLLDAFGRDALDIVGFTFFPVGWNEEKRELTNRHLTIRVTVRNHAPGAPQSFLNEGRQSALAIAVYLAARLICVPANEAALKLLVLDDLLISLDTTHRRPVLQLLGDLFADWQVILLTHDRFWFELAREQLRLKPWKAVEVYEQIDPDGLLTPMVRPIEEDLVAETLKQARLFLDRDYPAAAANYARAACELTLRRYCRKHELKVPYTDEPQKISLENLRGISSKKAKEVPSCRAAFDGLQLHQRFILNPLSHNPVEPVDKADVRAAIDAVALLASETAAHKPAP